MSLDLHVPVYEAALLVPTYLAAKRSFGRFVAVTVLLDLGVNGYRICGLGFR